MDRDDVDSALTGSTIGDPTYKYVLRDSLSLCKWSVAEVIQS